MGLLGFTSFEEFIMSFQVNSAKSGSAILEMTASADTITKSPSDSITTLKSVNIL